MSPPSDGAEARGRPEAQAEPAGDLRRLGRGRLLQRARRRVQSRVGQQDARPVGRKPPRLQLHEPKERGRPGSLANARMQIRAAHGYKFIFFCLFAAFISGACSNLGLGGESAAPRRRSRAQARERRTRSPRRREALSIRSLPANYSRAIRQLTLSAVCDAGHCPSTQHVLYYTSCD
jgi:hypothetical protein